MIRELLQKIKNQMNVEEQSEVTWHEVQFQQTLLNSVSGVLSCLIGYTM